MIKNLLTLRLVESSSDHSFRRLRFDVMVRNCSIEQIWQNSEQFLYGLARPITSHDMRDLVPFLFNSQMYWRIPPLMIMIIIMMIIMIMIMK